MFDPSEVKSPAPEEKVGRHFGHTKATFAPKNKKRGYVLKDAETGEAIESLGRPPNRKERRAYLSQAPRRIRLLARRSRESWSYTHKPHYSYLWQYFPPEEVIRLKEASEEEQAAALRYVKNMLKRQRRAA